jgi:pimeloyl-ACP methyl ester carboxylesterase
MSSPLTEIDSRLEPMPPGKYADPFRLEVGKSGLRLMLHRLPVKGGRPVLLLHGASAGSNTFLTPRSDTDNGYQNLVDYLAGQGFEPWLLDWRSSKYVAQRFLDAQKAQPTDRTLFNFDDAATEDIKAALDVIVRERGEDVIKEGIGAVGFCMGGAILAQALLKNVPGVSDRLSHVVIISLGLFYSMSLYGRLKAESRLLERIASEESGPRFLDPRIPRDVESPYWPQSVKDLYNLVLWRHPYDRARMDTEGVPESDRGVLEMFNRVSFMLGEPYLEANLVPEIHNTTLILDIEDSPGGTLPAGVLVRAESEAKVEGQLAHSFTGYAGRKRMVLCRHNGEFRIDQKLLADGQPVGRVATKPVVREPLLPDLFGAMALQFLIHGAENLRAGEATEFNTIPPVPHINGTAGQYAGFDGLKRITLIGGGLNRLWHRDSIDRMAAWLERNPGGSRSFVRHMLPNYGHQDLLWGRKSAEEVFPLIEAALR